jgi:micrococcal nuclease
VELGRGKGIGSLVLLLAVAAVLARPWEWRGDGAGDGPERVSGRVLRAVDGDTLEVRLNGGDVETVRLIGVDTPETVKPDTPVQCFGPKASAFEHREVEGQPVRLLLGVEQRDIYGRLLAYVWLQPRRDAGSKARFLETALLRRGLARTLTIPPNDRFAERFAALQAAAARSGRGLWGAC